ncbi:conserved hypothetical protein [Coccidioides posadasii str. Silveira]|uniref:rRNA adenine N(6)-methyltransferase n=1 Tax=Coccidioides posadasii (strain RMSCC 757 / Silveira) TaxID=443226 RepID=E9DK52_COCPS|nr:conserved hypothetical protein [Coccidioides posadasii str. Silveira]
MRRYLGLRPIHLVWTPVRHYSRSPSLSAASRDHAIHINSERLCDDVLERLAPTFHNTGPIDIIDLYPGIGLWSRKVNELLKPRRHILLEPNEKDYLPHLQPLLDRSPNYRLLPWEPLDERKLATLFSEEYLPEQLKRVLGPQGRIQVNPSLLILANMTRHRNSYSKKIFTFLRHLESCFDQTLFHQRGLGRMISLFSAADAENVLPRKLFGRRSLAGLQMQRRQKSYSLLGAPMRVTMPHSREVISGIDPQEQLQLARRMPGSLLREIESRSPIELAPEALALRPSDIPHFKRPRQDWHNGFLELYEEYKQNAKDNPGSTKLPDPKKESLFMVQRKRLLLENRESHIIADCLEKGLAIDDVHAQLRSIMQKGKPYPVSTPELVSKLEALTSEYDAVFSQLSMLSKLRAVQHIQEVRAYNNNTDSTDCHTPLLLWDRRVAEPLRIKQEELQPPIPCGIIDFHPNPSSPMLRTLQEYTSANKSREDYLDMISLFKQLIRIISRGNATAVDRSLLHPLFPGRPVTDLVEAIPSLRKFARVTATYPPGSTIRSAKDLQLTFAEDCLSGTYLRELPISVLWDIALEWNRWPMRMITAQELWKVLGGGGVQRIEATFVSRKN